MARADSPADDSPLSSVDSTEDEYGGDATEPEVEPMEDERPSKRQKLGGGAGSTTSSAAVVQEAEAEGGADSLDGMSDVSSDTDGDIPSSPVHARAEEDDFQEQVTVCAWEGCRDGDMGNMDRLVRHIHDTHIIENRAKKYTCEWVGCSRKSMPHASGYALKAHMRSHTREKPFYCYLPECDRAFTRSDALAKHMRTVHETEALRPSDPVPKSMQAASGRGSKLKIILKTPHSHASGHDDTVDEGSGADDSNGDMFTPLSEDQGFTRRELDMPLERLAKVCRLQLRLEEEENKHLQDEIKKWEELYKNEWLEKEVLLDQVIQTEQAFAFRRKAVLSGAADVQVPAAMGNGHNGSHQSSEASRVASKVVDEMDTEF